jgi:hypothetical protein
VLDEQASLHRFPQLTTAGTENRKSLPVGPCISTLLARGDRTSATCENCLLEKNTERPDNTSAARFSAYKVMSKKERFAGISADF